MYKVFIENREVNFTDSVYNSENTNLFFFHSHHSILMDLMPFILKVSENEVIVVVMCDVASSLKRIFSEFTHIEAAGGIVEHNKNFLFIKRNGFWDIPKGKLDIGENFENAAEREIEEECGLTYLKLNSFICSTFHTYFYRDNWYLKETKWYHFKALGATETKCQVEEGITETRWIESEKFAEIRENTFNSISFVLDSFEKNLKEEGSLDNAIKLLSENNVVAIPTETVYGLAANALSSQAVSQIFKIKNRPQTNPLIAHFGTIDQVKKYVIDFPVWAQKLAENFWPGPLTLLLEKNDLIPNQITAGNSRVGVRIPSHPLTLRLLQRLDFPLAAPSANKYGTVSPTCAEHVRIQFGKEIPFILDGGACEVGIESTIIGSEDDKLIVYRLGQITPEEVEETCGKSVYIKNEAGEIIVAPGMVKHHYAPITKLKIIEENHQIQKSTKTGVILFNEQKLEDIPFENQVILSEHNDLNEASQNLYRAFYQLDSLNLNVIYIKLFPEIGIGKSLNDRIKRAGLKE